MTICNPDIVPFPRVVRIEPASQCNLACRHCPTGTVDMARGLMKWETFRRVLDAIRNNREFVKVVVLYHGGEPLLNRRFFDMVGAVKELNSAIFVKTVSNGALMTGLVSERLIQSGLDAIEVSLDGESPEESQFIRRRSSARQVICNIKHLVREKAMRGVNRPDVYIASTRFLRRDHAHGKVLDAPTPTWLLREFGSAGVKGFKSNYAIQWPGVPVTDDYDVFTVAGREDGGSLCDHAINTTTIRANGDVVPCCYDLTSQLVMGNINEQSLEEIWNGARYQALRRAIRIRNAVSICTSCCVIGPARYLSPRRPSR